MNVILSIRPRYVKLMMEGTKKYEFRKVIFKNKNINNIYVYSTSPVKKIVGSFKIGEIVEDRPERLWDNLEDLSGLSAREFFTYFNGVKRGFAIRIECFEVFDDPLDPNDLMPGFVPPQSFCYLDMHSDDIEQRTYPHPRNLMETPTHQTIFPDAR
jgi:predicted transcriptional regulator